MSAVATVLAMAEADPVGIVEIAERLGVRRATVDQWRYHETGGFPAPKWTVGGRPAWDWSDIKRWAESTGRIRRP